MTDAKPNRRWFRFRLRTLFVVVTLFCLWLGWQVSIVRERQALLRDLQKAGGGALGDGDAGDGWDSNDMVAALRPLYRQGWVEDRPIHLSFVRRWLGDQGIYHIGLPDSLEHERKRFAAAFPEACVILWPSSALATATLIELVTESPRSADEFQAAKLRAGAIDVLGERKAQEAIPCLIECLADRRAVHLSDNWVESPVGPEPVGSYAASALQSITGRPLGIDQAEWRRWWKDQHKE